MKYILFISIFIFSCSTESTTNEVDYNIKKDKFILSVIEKKPNEKACIVFDGLKVYAFFYDEFQILIYEYLESGEFEKGTINVHVILPNDKVVLIDPDNRVKEHRVSRKTYEKTKDLIKKYY